ncbi:MAG: cache domain-containing protein [Acidobacteriia bacterium]|nr:cache domain-containing protein [Terriglobia bacterium]
MGRSTIRGRLIRSFSIAILIPSLITMVVGIRVIEQQIYAQAQAQVNSDLEGAMEIWRHNLERLENAIRIHATRMVIYGALARNDPGGLGPEMNRVRAAEGLDVLTLLDTSGKVFYRTLNPALVGDIEIDDELIGGVYKKKAPLSGVVIVAADELARESQDLRQQASMEITFTPRAGPPGKERVTDGMMLKAAAPVTTADGRFVGVLYGGTLINRNYEVVDKIRSIVFRQESYKNREVGTATVFQDDVRISTNVRNADGTRAITTRASAEVADDVLQRNRTWRGRAFVVNDWYIAAYAPIRDIAGKTIGMLYVGTLEQPYRDSLWRTLFTFLGITLLGMILVSIVGIKVAQRISEPIQAMAAAARRVAEGDYSHKVEVLSSDETGYLAECFNRMTLELARATQELRQWAESLETKVEERTAQVKAMQGQLVQAEKLAAIGKLAAGVAHEINNPLTGVLTNSSLMLQDLAPDDPRRDDLQTIVDETLRCRKIVKGLLDFARQTKPLKQAVNINQIVEDALNLVRNQASLSNITLQTELQADLPTIMVDKDQMRQVVLNIVINAAEALPNGGEIRVISRLDRGANLVCLSVADTGPGIPEAVRTRLFEPFFTTKASGTGLGLAIAYGIMERHRGTITVASAAGQGTTISLRLPVNSKEGDEQS